MTYSESPFSQLSDELWHVFGGRRRFPTTRALDLTLRLIFLRIELTLYDLRDNSQNMFPISIYLPNYEPELLGSS